MNRLTVIRLVVWAYLLLSIVGVFILGYGHPAFYLSLDLTNKTAKPVTVEITYGLQFGAEGGPTSVRLLPGERKTTPKSGVTRRPEDWLEFHVTGGSGSARTQRVLLYADGIHDSRLSNHLTVSVEVRDNSLMATIR